MALKMGLAHGQENPIPSIYAMKFHEVQNFISLTGHIVQMGLYIIKESQWQKLSKEFQTIVLDEAAKAAKKVTDLYVKGEEDLVPTLKRYMTFIEVDKSEFQNRAQQGGMDKWFGEKLGEDLYKKIKESK
jgi:TRAP-type C4-dicarboxylate transport system substrate-binding protein